MGPRQRQMGPETRAAFRLLRLHHELAGRRLFKQLLDGTGGEKHWRSAEWQSRRDTNNGI